MKVNKKKSKRTKLSTKYNLQKKVREHKRRVKKEAKKLGIKKAKKKDPGIPNSWPFKAQMLEELERQKAERDREKEERKLKAREENQQQREQDKLDKKMADEARETSRREKKAAEAEMRQLEALGRALTRSDILLELLDIRDPLGCRSLPVEDWAAQNGKRVVFVLTKVDLVPSALVASWIEILGQIAPTVAVAVESGREGVQELLQIVGHAPSEDAAAQGDTGSSGMVGIVGFAGTGKKSLAKALRQEVRGPAGWLLEGVGRLRPLAGPQDAARTLHMAVRGLLTRNSAFQDGDASASDVVGHLLTRAPQVAILRRFRIAAFEGEEQLLKTLAQGKTTCKGNPLRPEVMGRIVLSEQLQTPVCACTPPPRESLQAVAKHWEAHAASKQRIEAVMLSQLGVLKQRLSPPVPGMLELSSHGFGPKVDLSMVVSDTLEDDANEDEDLDGELEDEEDEDFEGEEEEEGEEDDMED
eukprot:CAMPEP_0178438860 /NCGR_PEP_ID=MMETSP0689_2-20121128/35827_1 /TAXON_ID=160604 /ORGANISM="Amphidinium massartii, Strain CS-259" /LENGTH=471 /DNA_ID=CAMNT_0020061309 /DNA_START=61 /DNA_END=1476 /DNA_ORIENTATION=-